MGRGADGGSLKSAGDTGMLDDTGMQEPKGVSREVADPVPMFAFTSPLQIYLPAVPGKGPHPELASENSGI